MLFNSSLYVSVHLKQIFSRLLVINILPIFPSHSTRVKCKLSQGCTNIGLQVAKAIKLCAVVHNIFRSSVYNRLDVNV